MSDLSNQNRPGKRQISQFFRRGGFKVIQAGVRVEPTDAGRADLTIEEPLSLGLQRGDLLLSSADLETWAIERMHEECSDKDSKYPETVP